MWLWATLAMGAVPEKVFPALAPADAPAQWHEWTKQKGLPASEMACDPLWKDEALICFKVEEKGKRRFVLMSDLTKWGVDLPALRTTVAARAKAALANQPAKTAVPGTDKSYWVSAEGDGWAAAGVLLPEVLADKLGGPFYVAVPTDKVLLAWRPGDSELDTIVAVGAKEMYDAAEWPVTAVVHQWTGTGWVAFVEAVPKAVPGADATSAPKP